MLWDQQQFLIRNTMLLYSEAGELLARITTEEAMPGLTAIYQGDSSIGNTSEFMLCNRVSGNQGEADCFLRSTDGVQLKRIQRIPNNRPLPLHFALEGQRDIKYTRDYRQIDVVAAHSPMKYGLGAVFKINQEEMDMQLLTHSKNSTIVPLTDSNGKIDRYLSVRVDVTARKQRDLELSERLKESNCLYAVRSLLEQDLSPEETCLSALELIMTAMQFSNKAVGMMQIDGICIATKNYRENLPVSINAPIVISNAEHGKIQVSYLENLPFLLPHEQDLIEIIAHDLAHWHERRKAENRMVEMATHDALTGLPNRYLLQDRISQSIARDARHHLMMAIMFIDLDHFKVINDSLGHDIGDLLLKEVANRLIACIRSEDTVARQGGDEFIVVLSSITNSLDAANVAQKILDKLTEPFPIREHTLHIGGSIGIALFPEDGTTAEMLLKNSDVAMYHAKENGRSNYQFFTHELNQSAHEKHILGLDLRYALERNELVLYYQPVINMPDRQLYSMEVLLRWQHPRHQLISPDRFIGLAEETGLIIPIGEWVIKTVCEQIKTWQIKGYDVPKVAINLSARQFRDNNLLDNIARILKETDVDARHIALELTESMLIDDVDKVVTTLNRIHAMGIHISIDDFGTGYSSLSYLKRFPINTLKIDRSFVRDITIDKNDFSIVSAIIAMAHSMEIEVIAEGIETEEQLNLLIAQKCDHFQGYYFSKPVALTEIESMLDRSAIQSGKIRFIRPSRKRT